MRTVPYALLPFVLSTVVTLVSIPAASADDYFLTIGGGYSPEGNQISLEKNVLFYQRLLSERLSESIPHDIYFADGESPRRDLQYSDPDAVPKANRLMGRTLMNEGHLDYMYRSHEVPGVHGASTYKNIETWFHEIGSKLQSGDRLIVYATAHGGKSDNKEQPYNSQLFTFESEPVKMKDLAGKLAALPEGVNVVLIMVQCYAGGFSHVIFNQGEAAKGTSARNVCGFFATTHDRPAAGCTPDIREEEYQEYSSFFWAALGSKTRLGESIPTPDYDEDGEVSLEEAHAYVLLTSDAVDIPTRTSGAYLRHYSKTEDNGWPDLIDSETPYEEMLKLASPVERAVLEGLSRQLNLEGNNRVEATREVIKQIEKRRGELAAEGKTAADRANELKGAIAKSIRNRWPELTNLLHGKATELLTANSAEFIKTVESHKDYQEFSGLLDKIEDIKKQNFDLDRKWAKCQRFFRTAEDVALAANLSKVAAPEIQQRYKQLLAAERGTLQGARQPVEPTETEPTEPEQTEPEPTETAQADADRSEAAQAETAPAKE
ncbi:MAG: hypothetical protein WBF93_19565 [Pirellulales bacterium]